MALFEVRYNSNFIYEKITLNEIEVKLSFKDI